MKGGWRSERGRGGGWEEVSEVTVMGVIHLVIYNNNLPMGFPLLQLTGSHTTRINGGTGRIKTL